VKTPAHLSQLHDLLALDPDRLGHATLLTPEVRQAITERRLPIEVSISSNLACRTIDRLEESQLGWAYRAGLPVFICVRSNIFSS
jgi:adenosine deaminase